MTVTNILWLSCMCIHTNMCINTYTEIHTHKGGKREKEGER